MQNNPYQASILPQTVRANDAVTQSGLSGLGSDSGYKTLSGADWLKQQGITPQQQPQQQKPQEQWWQSILPTVGSIIGGLGAAALAPETGGLSLLALGALGSGLGAGAGKIAENVSTGQEATKDVGQEALTSGVTGLAFGGAGKVLAKPAQKLGARFFASQAPKISSKTAQTMTSELGFKSPEQAGQLGKVLSGDLQAPQGQSLITKLVRDEGTKNRIVFDDAGKPIGQAPIDLSDFYTPANVTPGQQANLQFGNDTLSKLLQKNSLSVGNDARNARNTVANLFNTASEGATAGGGVNFDKALQFQKDLNAKASEYWQNYTRSGKTTDKNLAQFYTDASNTIKEKIGLGQGFETIPLTNDAFNTLKQDILSSGTKGSQQFINRLDRLRNSGQLDTLAQLRSEEANFAEIGGALSAKAQANEKRFALSPLDIMAGVAGSAGGPLGIAAGLGGAKILESDALKKLATGIMGRAGRTATDTETVKQLSRMGKVGYVAPSVAAAAIPALGMAGPTDNQQNTTGTMQPTQGGLGMDNAGVQQAPLTSLYDTLLQNYLVGGPAATGSQNLVSQLAGLAPRVQGLGELQRLQGNLGSLYGQMGPITNPVQGGARFLSQFIPGTPEYQYRASLPLLGGAYQAVYGVPSSSYASALPNIYQGGGQAALAGQFTGAPIGQ